ncbi:hypothetical protein PLICRDRAFT_170064 [Plicaturopsis crispa FD-325 SS-3]|nr:hypothetical protein PLICRDRAFT_170064 [Plicaturopsis crispa FD-325 SS-3]
MSCHFLENNGAPIAATVPFNLKQVIMEPPALHMPRPVRPIQFSIDKFEECCSIDSSLCRGSLQEGWHPSQVATASNSPKIGEPVTWPPKLSTTTRLPPPTASYTVTEHSYASTVIDSKDFPLLQRPSFTPVWGQGWFDPDSVTMPITSQILPGPVYTSVPDTSMPASTHSDTNTEEQEVENAEEFLPSLLLDNICGDLHSRRPPTVIGYPVGHDAPSQECEDCARATAAAIPESECIVLDLDVEEAWTADADFLPLPQLPAPLVHSTQPVVDLSHEFVVYADAGRPREMWSDDSGYFSGQRHNGTPVNGPNELPSMAELWQAAFMYGDNPVEGATYTGEDHIDCDLTWPFILQSSVPAVSARVTTAKKASRSSHENLSPLGMIRDKQHRPSKLRLPEARVPFANYRAPFSAGRVNSIDERATKLTGLARLRRKAPRPLRTTIKTRELRDVVAVNNENFE